MDSTDTRTLPEDDLTQPDWDQFGAPSALLATDGSVLRSNRSFQTLLCGVRHAPALTGLDWLACLAPESRVALFTALADQRNQAGPLVWTASRNGQPRWFAASLRWQGASARCLMIWHDVTPLRESEQSALERGEQMAALVHSAPQMTAGFDAQSLRCHFANRAFAVAMGRDVGKLLGRRLQEVLGPDLLALVEPAIGQLRLSLRTVVFETDLRDSDAGPRRVEVHLAPQLDEQHELVGLALHLVDMTRQRDSERAHQQSEARLQRFMRGSIEGIVFHDLGIIVDANPAFCRLVDRGLHELIGLRLEDLVAGPLEISAQSSLAPALVTPMAGVRRERYLRQAHGQLVPVDWIDLGNDAESDGLHMTAVRDIRDHKAAQAHAHYLTHHDPLTGLPNRRAFLSQLEHLMVAARASATQLGLLFIDLDDFKRVNDSIGHVAADRHLVALAHRLGDQVRSTDRVARFGGDEFMVLLPGVREVEDVAGVARKLIEALAAPIEIEGRPISVTPSIGVALYPRDANTPDELIQRAETAMHDAKTRGRASVTVFDPAIAESAYDSVVLEGELGHAVAQGEFLLFFQPQVDARSGRPRGVEALLRWRHPERGLLAPGAFIDLAEQHRLILPIGRWVLHEAARVAAGWRDAGLPPLTMAVNLSALQFDAGDFVDSIDALLRDYEGPSGWLELEVTERMLVEDLAAARDRLHALRERGVRIAIDDFGTGHSSLAQLQDLPVDRLKIDQRFVSQLPQDRSSLAITRAIVQLAQGLGLSVVAEGVETAAQRACLAGLGCDELQGLAVSGPLEADALQAWVLALAARTVSSDA